ncbi:hypothetical protein D9756_005165 [Leucocoprinus leucothites]|uniref:Uncharacterized protein n=1 Tax=Leucocoprinus leucothites TaxID=201217 RepID=A0A8H5G9T9_9AGAR|nr:hypothetical protein D9756_005165 [Leucoagaricus leucothites]
MAPSTNIEPRSTSEQNGQSGTIVIAVLVSIGGAIVLSFVVVAILLVLRRKRRPADDIPYRVSPPALRSHKINLSDASMNPLLKADWDYSEKFAPPTRRSTDEVTREDRDILSNNPSGLYHIPSLHTLNHSTFSPTPSSYCLPHGPDAKTVSDHHSPLTATSERPPLPPLPPLVIPDQLRYSQPWHAGTAEEGSFQIHTLSRASSTSSHYSQPTAESTPVTPEYFQMPLSQELAYEAPQYEEGLHRGETQVVGTLLKARARRNPNGLVRTSSQVSQIERSGSIKSVASIHHDNRPYAKRYRSKKGRSNHIGEMEVVKEASEGGSLRSRSDSSATTHWDSGLLVQMPPRAAVPHSPPPMRV